MARIAHPTSIRGRGCGQVPGQASCGCMVVECQGARGGCVPFHSLCPQHWPVSHWFVAYCTLQQVGEAAQGRKWEARREALEIKASLLVHAFWHKTDIDLMMASVKHCWEPAPRALHQQGEYSPTAHVISYLNELAVCIPILETWDQMVWPTTVAIPCIPTEAESYSYCQGQAVDLSPVMPAVQFHVTEERGTYLCTTRALVFKGSILVYNPALNETEWVPVCGLANDLSWAEERSAVALANYVPHVSVEAAWITRLRKGWVMSCPGNDSSTMSMEGEESQFSDAPSTNPPTDTDHEVGEERKKQMGGCTLGMRLRQTHAPTDTSALKTGRPLWKSQKG